MRTSKNRKIFSANNEQGTRIFTLGLHYSCIPSYNNIVKIFSNRPAVAGLIKKVQLSWTNQKVQLSWTNKKSPAVAISEGRLPLCNTSSEAGALPSEVRIENDSDRKFSKSIFFQSFSGNHFLPVSLLAENIFSVFRSPHLPLDTLIKKSSYSWTNQKVQL